MCFPRAYAVACSVFVYCTSLVLDHVPQVTKAILDTQFQADVERTKNELLLDDDPTAEASPVAAFKGRKAIQCMCGCWKTGTQCPTVCLRSCLQLRNLRVKRKVWVFAAAAVALRVLLFLLLWLWRRPDANWPQSTAFQASVPVLPEYMLSDSFLELRADLLKHLDAHEAACGASAADVGVYVQYVLLRVGKPTSAHSCPSFAVRCTQDEVVFELVNPELTDVVELASTSLAYSGFGQTPKSFRRVKTQSLLCPHPCTREEEMQTPVTVVFSSTRQTLHTLDLRDSVAMCFQHHYKVARGQWPCQQCLEEERAP